MKLVALSLASLGIVTGLFFVLSAWIFGTPTGAASTFIAPNVVFLAMSGRAQAPIVARP